jgi:flagellar biogenesis protein FliO
MRQIRQAILAAAMLAIFAAPVSAQTMPATERSTAPAGEGLSKPPVSDSRDENKLISTRKNKGVDSLSGWGQTLLALGIVAGLIFVARMILGRFGRRVRIGDNGGVMEVLTRAYLAPKCQLLLVRLGDRLLLVGIGPNGPTALGEVSDPSEVESLLKALGKGGAMKATAETSARGEEQVTEIGKVAQKIRNRLSRQEDRK